MGIICIPLQPHPKCMPAPPQVHPKCIRSQSTPNPLQGHPPATPATMSRQVVHFCGSHWGPQGLRNPQKQRNSHVVFMLFAANHTQMLHVLVSCTGDRKGSAIHGQTQKNKSTIKMCSCCCKSQSSVACRCESHWGPQGLRNSRKDANNKRIQSISVHVICCESQSRVACFCEPHWGPQGPRDSPKLRDICTE